jgi:hypothetical protein
MLNQRFTQEIYYPSAELQPVSTPPKTAIFRTVFLAVHLFIFFEKLDLQDTLAKTLPSDLFVHAQEISSV